MACKGRMTMGTKTVYIGIDPGKGGAIAIVSKTGFYSAKDWPGDETLAAKIVRNWNLKYNIKLGIIEKVSAMPKQGSVSMFTFGTNYGVWRGILASFEIPFILVPPRTWQTKKLDKKAGNDTKERSLNTARRIFPKASLARKKDNGRSDALLIALYAKEYDLGVL